MGRKRKLLHEHLNTPSVPKVRRFSPAAGKATRNNKTSTLYTPLNEKAISKGAKPQKQGTKENRKGGKRKPNSYASKTPKTEKCYEPQGESARTAMPAFCARV